MLQVRNIPDRLHRELVRRARRRGCTITQYVQEILEREVASPSWEELKDRIASRESVDLGRPASEVLASERASRK